MIKKVFLLIITCFMTLMITACTSNQEIIYTDNEPFVIEMKGETLKILQITDLHLMYGIDHRDQRTLKLIRNLNNRDDYDLIVITGDLTMSPSAPRLFTQLLNFMESLETPWTFVFGNHETDFHSYHPFLNRIKDTKYLYFKVGPMLEDGGVGNFKITFTKSGVPFYHTYFLDSKSERKDYTKEEGQYDYLSHAQVSWYEAFVSNDTQESIVFMHIPLRQYILANNYVGTFNEKMVYAQGKDTGFFDAMVTYGKSKAVFVGHDHLNDFYFYLEGILLAYGRATGFNGYGTLEKGGRHIEILENLEINTFLIGESEVLYD